MTFGTRVRLAALALATVLGTAGPATGLAADSRALSDDKCTAQCDEESDRCMQHAGKDASKQKACDTSYDECLRKCQ